MSGDPVGVGAPPSGAAAPGLATGEAVAAESRTRDAARPESGADEVASEGSESAQPRNTMANVTGPAMRPVLSRDEGMDRHLARYRKAKLDRSPSMQATSEGLTSKTRFVRGRSFRPQHAKGVPLLVDKAVDDTALHRGRVFGEVD